MRRYYRGWSESIPSQLLMNYYAIALLLDSIPSTASGPRVDNSSKTALHHVASKLRTPVGPASSNCPERMIAPVRAVPTSINLNVTPAVSAHLALQCFGCCGPGCYCIHDRAGFAMYSAPCAEHDACVGQYGSHFARQCTGKLLKAVLYVWWMS